MDTTALVASVKRRASVPTTQATISSTDFLSLCDEEMQGYVVPLVVASRSEYMVTTVDQFIAGSTSFRVPTRAVGGKLRDVKFLNVAGAYAKCPQVAAEQLDLAPSMSHYLEGNTLKLWNGNRPIDQSWPWLRLRYYTRPNALVYPTSAGVVLSVNGAAITLSATPPAGFVTGALFDVVRARPGFECLATDQAGTVAGNVVTLPGAVTDIAVGDYVCLAGQAPVPQIPLELHPLLAQAVAVKCLQAVGDIEGQQAAITLLARMEKDAIDLIAQRVEGEPQKIVNRSSLFRCSF
jgi:hypothetical protein